MAPAKCSYLFGCELGDPISSIHMDRTGCMAGSMMGKVWYLGFESDRPEVLVGFSDEGVRGLHMDPDTIFVTYFESCRTWRRSTLDANCSQLNFRSLDRKNTNVVKHVLQRGNMACVLFPFSTLVLDLSTQEHCSRPFKLFELGSSSDAAPCDFDGESLAVLDRSDPTSPPVLRVVHLEKNEQHTVDDLPKSRCISVLRLWGTNSVAYASGASVYLYDYTARTERGCLTGSRADVLALDAKDAVAVTALSTDSVVRIWNGVSGNCLRTLEVPEATFFLGFPYHVCMYDTRVLVSADQGVFLVEFEDGEV